MFIRKKEYNNLITHAQKLVSENNELKKVNHVLHNRRVGLTYLDEEIKKIHSDREDKKKLSLMRVIAELDLCYSNYVTKDYQGKICIDINQVPTTYEEMINKLKKSIDESSFDEGT